MIEKLKAFFKGKRVLILGFGREGRSTLEILKQCDCAIGIADIKLEASEELKGCELHSGENYLDCLENYDIIMKTPGIALLGKISESVKAKITGQTDLLLRFCPNTIIGVTGTKGKSTTSSLIYHILKTNGFETRLIGNIGVPPLDIVGKLSEKTVLVCEMSCHQLEYVKASPDIAVLLNIYEEHLDHYVDFAAYAAAKENIFLYQNENDTLIYGTDCRSEKLIAAKCDKISASLSEKADIYVDENIHICGIEISRDKIKTQLLGHHNLYNIAIAIAAAVEVGCELEGAINAVESFAGLSHRLEKVSVINGIEYVNDSISTVPATAIAAIDAFPEADTLILGGMDRGISYKPLIDYLRGLGKVKTLILLPDSGRRIADEYDNPRQRLVPVKDMAEAVEKAATLAKKRVILSPAAASYGFYKNFEERGKHFKELVNGLTNK